MFQISNKQLDLSNNSTNSKVQKKAQPKKSGKDRILMKDHYARVLLDWFDEEEYKILKISSILHNTELLFKIQKGCIQLSLN